MLSPILIEFIKNYKNVLLNPRPLGPLGSYFQLQAILDGPKTVMFHVFQHFVDPLGVRA